MEKPKLRNTTIDEENLTTQLPDSDRAIYGFAFYVLNWILFVSYLIWVLTPYTYLEYFSLSFLPSKFYGLCLPLLVPFSIVIYITGVFICNIINFQGIYDEESHLKNDFGR
uniref:PIG-P domain-containing protein n=1 Tax=Parastrongyloides trichosuri TaxID=131310 RepID=A0A0N4ZQ30_PARTI